MSGQMWSPTKARLNRRRNKATKLMLDLSGHIRGDAPLVSASSSAEDDVAMKQKVENTIAKLPPDKQKLLEIIKDKETYSVRERVEAEVELNKDPDLSQLMRDMKYVKGRSSLLGLKNKTEEEQAKIMEELIKEEEERDQQEKKGFKDKKQLAAKEKKDNKERQAKALRDANTQVANQRAKDTAALKDLAATTNKKVAEKIDKKEQEDKEHEAYKEDMLKHEDNDVIRTLKEARLDQRDMNTKL
jgi:hypothetical protein